MILTFNLRHLGTEVNGKRIVLPVVLVLAVPSYSQPPCLLILPGRAGGGKKQAKQYNGNR